MNIDITVLKFVIIYYLAAVDTTPPKTWSGSQKGNYQMSKNDWFLFEIWFVRRILYDIKKIWTVIHVQYFTLTVRDQARRSAIKQGKRVPTAQRNNYTGLNSPLNTSRTSSDAARDEMLAMVSRFIILLLPCIQVHV